MSKTIYYTLIGSRETPEDIMQVMTDFTEKCCKFDYVVRSGGADGADSCAELGVLNYINKSYDGALGARSYYQEIYLPWKDFNGRKSSDTGYYTLGDMSNWKQAEDIASKTHPAWDKCKQGAQKLHSRNVYQLLGQDLATPSRFVLCWAKPKYQDRRTEEVQGGTATAVKLGIDNNVEIINLYWTNQLERIKQWVYKPL